MVVGCGLDGWMVVEVEIVETVETVAVGQVEYGWSASGWCSQLGPVGHVLPDGASFLLWLVWSVDDLSCVGQVGIVGWLEVEEVGVVDAMVVVGLECE